MIELKESARKELEAYFAGKERETIRIYLVPGGCHGPRLALALDNPGEDDDTADADGFPFCINRELAKMTGGLVIDFNCMGFLIEPEIPLPAPEGPACGSCCGSCGGGCGSH